MSIHPKSRIAYNTVVLSIQTTSSCVYWPNNDVNVQTHPSLTDIISYISPAGWTIFIADCTGTCTACSVPPTSCTGSADVMVTTTYVDVPNLVIRPAPASVGRFRLVMDGTTWASEAANNESYPCSPFVITTHNVTIRDFTFTTAACVAEIPGFLSIAGMAPSLLWLMTTPVIVLADVAPLTHLKNLAWVSLTSVNSRGDAIARIVPNTPGVTIDLNGSIFEGLSGRVDLDSPVARSSTGTSNIAPALLISVHSGTITVSSTRYMVMRTDSLTYSVGAWMGSTRAMSGALVPDCPVCRTKEELHKTNLIYIIVTASLGGIFVIVTIVLIIVHVRDRRKMDQLELAKFEKKE